MSDVEPSFSEREVGSVLDAADPVRTQENAPGFHRSPGLATDNADHSIDLSSDESVIDLRDRVGSGRDCSAPIDDLARRALFGLNFVDAPSLEPVLEAILERPLPSGDGVLETVLTPNADIMVHLMASGADRSVEWSMFERSQYCLPDGQPIVLSSRLLGQPLSARLTGSGLFAMLWPRLVADRRAVFTVASSEVIVERLEAEYPDLRSIVAPMFSADDIETINGLAKAVIASASTEALDYVILGIGNPKDTLIAASVLRQWPSELGRPPAIMALGASASMYVGLTKRAPRWMQRVGLEWFHRFCQEPRRLFRRYFIRDLGFVKLVWHHWRLQRQPRRATGQG